MTKAKFIIVENYNFISIQLKGHFDYDKHCAFFTGAFYAISKELSRDAKRVEQYGNTTYQSRNKDDIEILRKFITFIYEWVAICEEENPKYKIPIEYQSDYLCES